MQFFSTVGVKQFDFSLGTTQNRKTNSKSFFNQFVDGHQPAKGRVLSGFKQRKSVHTRQADVLSEKSLRKQLSQRSKKTKTSVKSRASVQEIYSKEFSGEKGKETVLRPLLP